MQLRCKKNISTYLTRNYSIFIITISLARNRSSDNRIFFNLFRFVLIWGEHLIRILRNCLHNNGNKYIWKVIKIKKMSFRMGKTVWIPSGIIYCFGIIFISYKKQQQKKQITKRIGYSYVIFKQLNNIVNLIREKSLQKNITGNYQTDGHFVLGKKKLSTTFVF